MKHILLLLFVCVSMISITAQPFSQTTISSSISLPENINRVDLDKDGDEDVVCFSGTTSIEFFSNNGDGTYSQSTLYSGLSNQGHFEIADMDNDNELDIIASDLLNEMFVFLKNDGSENFTAHIITNDVADLNNPIHFAIANFDGDNYKDIVVCAQHANDAYGVFFVKNNGNGTFAAPDLIKEDDFVNKVIASDFDGDNDIDIIVTKNGMFTSGGLYKGVNNGSGSFTYSAITTAKKFDRITLTNLDGDTDQDFIVSDNTTGLYWYENNGSFTFTEHQITHPYTGSSDRLSFVPINVDGDSDVDIFFYSFITGSTNMDVFDVGYFENNGSQDFSTINYFLEDQPEFSSVVPVNLDNDADMDFYLGSEDNSTLILYKNLEIDNPTDINIAEKGEVKVYPNPATDVIFIECAELIDEVVVLDIVGQVVKKVELSTTKATVDISELSAGIYNVVVKSGEIKEIRRVVKK